MHAEGFDSIVWTQTLLTKTRSEGSGVLITDRTWLPSSLVAAEILLVAGEVGEERGVGLHARIR